MLRSYLFLKLSYDEFKFTLNFSINQKIILNDYDNID